MEFLRELTELSISELYHHPDDTKWIGQHLTDEVIIWWRLIRHKIKNVNDFKEEFTDKYWGQYTQEHIRYTLEYGHYRRKENLSMVQYMERSIL